MNLKINLLPAPFWIIVAFCLCVVILSVQTGGTPSEVSARFFSVFVLCLCLLLLTAWLCRFSVIAAFVAVLVLPLLFCIGYLIGRALAFGGWSLALQHMTSWLEPIIGPTLSHAVRSKVVDFFE